MRFGISICLLGAVALSGLAQDKFPAPPFDEVGVYYQHDGHWIDLMPEVINWKTGGVLKSLSTAGIVKGDVNGYLNHAASKTPLSGGARLLVYCIEGTAITEYQLIRMHAHSHSREFRTVTGGVFHVSGGAKRDTLDFESEHVARRTYLVKLPDLPAGEYGLLAPGASMSNSASAQLGKMYTFSIGRPDSASAAQPSEEERPLWKKVVF